MSSGEETIATSAHMPLPIDIIEEQLRQIGYSAPSGTTVRRYDYLTETAGRQQVDLVAFADPQHFDISTACIATKLGYDEQDRPSELRKLSYMGAPMALFAFADRVEVWPVVSPAGLQSPQRPERLSYKRLPNYFREHREELAPRSLLNAKQGSQQLSFIDVDASLESFARAATKKTLTRQFTRAIASIPHELRARYPEDITRLAIWILAARILQDKLGYQHDVYSDFRAVQNVVPLLETAQNFFPNYFMGVWEHIAQVGTEALDSFYEGLSREFTFRSLTNDMLAYFYENTLVTREMRENLGVYYTPQKTIAERILHRLPIEDLPLEKRTILDGTCGSGNLLLAAYDRLLNLLPCHWTSQRRHEYLLQRIWGTDIDPFACEIARLSLLLYSLPEGDSWQIKTSDVLQDTPQDLFGDRPNVIIGNPPFKEPRSVEGQRVQTAALVLDRYLEWLEPNGLLGVVVPITFLQNTSGKHTRNRLLTNFDVMEVWHLPEGAIPSSSAGTAVILARKLPKSYSKASARLARAEKVGQLEHNQAGPQRELSSKYTISYLVSHERWLSDPQSKMESSKFDRIWDRISTNFPAIHPNYGAIFNGVQAGKEARATHFSEESLGSGWRPVLYGNPQGKVLEPYLISWENQTRKYIKYPSNELQWPRSPSHFECHSKVVVNATRNASSPWRFYAAIDTQRLVVTENFHYVLPNEGSVEELTAVLNSTVANAWYSSRNYQRDVNLGQLKRLPFPRFSEQQRWEIRPLVRQMEQLLKSSDPQRVVEMRQVIDRLDNIVCEAYGLDGEEKEQIDDWMNRFKRPGRSQEDVSLEATPQPVLYRGRQWEVTCEVESVSSDHEAISLWVMGSGNSEGVLNMSIPDSMPGWALRPGTAFVASIPWDHRYRTDLSRVEWLDFRPLEFSHLSEEELLSLLSEQR